MSQGIFFVSPPAYVATPAGSFPASLMTAVREMVPATVICEGGSIGSAHGTIFPEEELLVARAVPRRRNEFFAGRQYARTAMSALGVPPSPILTGSSREPIWPNGVSGCISHSADLCVTAVGKASEFLGVGLDIETEAPSGDMVRLICTSAELRSLVHPLYEWDCNRLLTLFFVIKEAVYKLYFPLARQFLDFHQVAVELELEQGNFQATLRNDCPAAAGHRIFYGRFAVIDGVTVAFVAART